ncbi:hypothetical protein XELAEV_18033459mg [Xenopus laevis]|uniref:Uncharacterized protein n=1 Tax=Xenopus laevis TaxID=8355 RepID=A0A974HE02_XENLA|nr:hypothetical protein XELAEV_18033459mg [Xenopus laevis]
MEENSSCQMWIPEMIEIIAACFSTSRFMEKLVEFSEDHTLSPFHHLAYSFISVKSVNFLEANRGRDQAVWQKVGRLALPMCSHISCVERAIVSHSTQQLTDIVLIY